ncbi:Rhodanese-like protein [Cucurbitaria berberidis CBS 394.84]|uniref:Rhodanese-like protein n=1 Tax=Cucurbitaria berberidis CBS 394.84 TaxID=1168544 RepID=A0A9P4L6R2_9PLEO|nr:Rhodanese-like protein [Cucurbitaria berberidis CBS 394.84]KAF1843559.1 Rhodanese-like protein [Cucurbitaria berberidis CBS 394.84]
MSTISLSDLQYISRESLADSIKSSSTSTDSNTSLPSNTAIIDVRDSDHIGGHIRGSTWIPSSQLDYKVPELIRTLRDKQVVVFHCALSQQRGPSAALRYIREKERLDAGRKVESKSKSDEEGEKEEEKVQKVYVLKGGFTEWQEKYGADEQLTEGWKKDLWEFGY